MIEDEHFEDIVSPIFECQLFKPISNVFIEKIDSEIAKITGITSGTSYEKLQEDTNASATLKQILNAVKELDTTNLNLQSIGQILTILQENAKTQGAFEETFLNFIWYLTGDNLANFKTEGHQPFDQAQTIKEYLKSGTLGTPGTKEFYCNVSFTEKFAEIQKAKEFGEKLKDLPEFNVENAEEFKNKLQESVSGLETQEVVDILEEDLAGFVNKEELNGKLGENKDLVKSAIGEAFKDEQQAIGEAFIKFLGLDA